MAITFPITGVTSGYGSSQSPSFTLGTAPAEHDILVAYLSTSINTGTFTDPGGWVNVLGTDARVIPADSSSVGVMLYHRVTAAEAAAGTVTWTFTNLWAAASRGATTVAVLRGVALTGELVGADSASDTNEVTPWVIPSVTPTADDCQVIAGLSADYASGTAPNTQAAAPWQWTLRAGNADSQSNYLYSRDTLGSSGVATGVENVTPSAADEYVSIIACFAPATATTTTGTATGTISAIGAASGSFATKLFAGSTAVDAVYVGDQQVSRVYYGSVRVF